MQSLVPLVMLGLGSVGLWLWVAQWRILADHGVTFLVVFCALLLLYGLAVSVIRFRGIAGRGALVVVFAIALLMRLVLVRQPPTASDDIYRYVWDGRVQVAGINPYAYPPADPALVSLRDTNIYPGINRKPVRTIYPPVAETMFRLVYLLYPNSVTWTKLALSLFDLSIAALLARMLARAGFNPCLVLIYAWQPLLVLEVAHSGHIDIAAVFFLLLAMQARGDGRVGTAGVWLACAFLVKFYILAALPALLSGAFRRREWRLPVAFGATVLLAYLPFLSVGTKVLGFLGGYAQEEGFTSGGRYFFLQAIVQVLGPWTHSWQVWYAQSPFHRVTATDVYTGFMLGIIGVIAVSWFLRPAPPPSHIARRVALLLLLLFGLTTTSQPWYVLVLLVCVPFLDLPMALACSLVVACAGFTYLHWWLPDRPDWPYWVAYGGRAVALVIVASHGLRRWRSRTRNLRILVARTMPDRNDRGVLSQGAPIITDSVLPAADHPTR